MPDNITLIEGEFCRAHMEDNLWKVRSLDGRWQGYNCPASDPTGAYNMVKEYDERVRKRIDAEERRLGRMLSDEEIRRNPNWKPPTEEKR